MKHLQVFILIIMLALALAGPVAAQGKSDVSEVPFSKAPYRVGERLTYNVSFANFFTAAHVELFIAGRGTYFNRDGLQLRTHIETTGVVNAALYSINNDYIAFINPENGQPFRAQELRREAGRNQDTSREYNQPAGADAIPTKLRTGGFPGTYDVLSALYRLRALPLSQGSRYRFEVRHNDIPYEAELKVTGRQLVKTSVGSFNAIVTQLRFPTDSSADNFRVQIYFSDDERHVPLLVTARHPAGDIRAELVGSELSGGAVSSETTTLAPAIGVRPTPAQPAPNPRANNSSGIAGIPGFPMTATAPNATAPRVPSTTASALPAGLPFAAGEELNFNIYLENVAQPVGNASFQVRARSKYLGRDSLLLTGKAQTTGAAQAIFSANDQINTYVDPTTLLPFRFEMTLQETKRRLKQVVTIDQDRGHATTEGGARVDVPVGTYDLLSAFYALRSFNLRSTRPNAVSLFVNNRPRTLFITFLKRETIELGGQQIPALQLSLTTDDPQGDRNGLRLWVSEDQRRLPLRLTVVTTSGRVRADLAIIPIVRQ